MLFKRYGSWILLFCTVISFSLMPYPTKGQTAERPLIFPVTGAPGPAGWLFGQPYGNTTGAYNFGTQWYSAGQGLHFGIDIGMPCGTPLVAVADGEVTYVDNLAFGSGPHNLILRHLELGITTLYGHLYRPAPVIAGQFVRQGDIIAYSGDPDLTCDSRPHLHLEIRSLDYRTTYNPVNYIDIPWHSLAIAGSYSYPLFQGDMDHARRWLTLSDQPDVQFGGRRLNDYAAPYPPAGNLRPPENPPLRQDLAPLDTAAGWQLRTIGSDGCCRLHWWHPTDPDRLYTIDGTDGQRAAVYEWSAAQGTMQFLAEEAPPTYKSPDGSHEIRMEGSSAVLRQIATGTETRIETGGAVPALSADNTQVMWVNTGLSVPGGNAPFARINASNPDGTNSREILSGPGLSARWLDASRLLINVPDVHRLSRLYVFDTATSDSFELLEATWLRALSVAPGGGRLLYYLSYQADPTASSIYSLETQPGAQPQAVPWFGGWRWRDADSVYYIPQDLSTSLHTLHHYDLTTGVDTPLTDPAALPFTVMDGDWSVSPDGRRIAFRDALTSELSLLEIGN